MKSNNRKSQIAVLMSGLFIVGTALVILNILIYSSVYERILFQILPSQYQQEFSLEERMTLAEPLRTFLIKGEALPDTFTERELIHMNDVKRLFDWQRAAMIISLMLVGLYMVHNVYFRARWPYYLFRGYRTMLYLFGIIVSIWIFFQEQVYRGFHQLLFRNDFWLLDPRYHMLITIYPPEFFIDFITGYIILIVVYIIIFGMYIARKLKNFKH